MNDERILLSIIHWRKLISSFEILIMNFMPLCYLAIIIKVTSRYLLNVTTMLF